jgi:hypothetical protein
MSFCANCGAPLEDGTRFCAKCGAQTGSPAIAQPNASHAAPPPGGAAPKRGLGAGAKLAISAVLIIFVGGIAAAFYVGHKMDQKYHEIRAEVTGTADPNGTADSGSANTNLQMTDDPCRYLSKEEVGAAIGVEIVKTQADGDGCSYLAKGKAADMAAKHASSILGGKEADGQQQKIAEQFAKTIFNSFPQDGHDADGDGSGNVAVLSVSVSNSSAAIAEMKLNAKIMEHLGGQRAPATGEDLDIGDQAFVSSDGVIMIRKGEKVIRIMYMSCPCGTKQVIPLARKLADSLQRGN